MKTFEDGIPVSFSALPNAILFWHTLKPGAKHCPCEAMALLTYLIHSEGKAGYATKSWDTMNEHFGWGNSRLSMALKWLQDNEIITRQYRKNSTGLQQNNYYRIQWDALIKLNELYKESVSRNGNQVDSPSPETGDGSRNGRRVTPETGDGPRLPKREASSKTSLPIKNEKEIKFLSSSSEISAGAFQALPKTTTTTKAIENQMDLKEETELRKEESSETEQETIERKIIHQRVMDTLTSEFAKLAVPVPKGADKVISECLKTHSAPDVCQSIEFAITRQRNRPLQSINESFLKTIIWDFLAKKVAKMAQDRALNEKRAKGENIPIERVEKIDGVIKEVSEEFKEMEYTQNDPVKFVLSMFGCGYAMGAEFLHEKHGLNADECRNRIVSDMAKFIKVSENEDERNEDIANLKRAHSDTLRNRRILDSNCVWFELDRYMNNLVEDAIEMEKRA